MATFTAAPVADAVSSVPSGTAASPPRRAFVAQIMGLPMSVHVRGPRAHEDAVAEAVASAFEELRTDEAMFSIWRPDSPVSRIRDGRDQLSEAHPRIRHVAGLCELAGQRTGGAFSAWLPDVAGTLRFEPTGLVKGWAVSEAFAGLRRRLAGMGPRCSSTPVGTSCGVQSHRHA